MDFHFTEGLYWPAKVTARSAGGRSLAVTCYWRHNLRRSSLHWSKRWTGLNLTLRVNDRYPKFWSFVKRPYWWISALWLKCKVWKFGTNWVKSEKVIAKKQGLTGSEIHSNSAVLQAWIPFLQTNYRIFSGFRSWLTLTMAHAAVLAPRFWRTNHCVNNTVSARVTTTQVGNRIFC